MLPTPPAPNTKAKRSAVLIPFLFSHFTPTKTSPPAKAGMVCTPDETLAEEISLLKFHGMSREAWKRFAASGTPNYDIMLPGYKYNMMDIQAAIGLHQLPRLDGFIERRKEIAEQYNAAFADMDELALPDLCPLPAAPCLAPLYAVDQNELANHRPGPVHGRTEKSQHRQRAALQGDPSPQLVPRKPAGS
jgi:hypothetical protein